MSEGKVFHAVGKGLLEVEWPSSFTKKEMNVIERFLSDVRKNADGIGAIYDISIEDERDEVSEEDIPEINGKFDAISEKYMEEKDD